MCLNEYIWRKGLSPKDNVKLSTRDNVLQSHNSDSGSNSAIQCADQVRHKKTPGMEIHVAF